MKLLAAVEGLGRLHKGSNECLCAAMIQRRAISTDDWTLKLSLCNIRQAPFRVQVPIVYARVSRNVIRPAAFSGNGTAVTLPRIPLITTWLTLKYATSCVIRTTAFDQIFSPYIPKMRVHHISPFTPNASYRCPTTINLA